MKVALLLVLALGACGGETATVDALVSTCGHPGDMGNEVGIGKFCTDGTMCTSSAPLCSIIGDDKTHFCTRTCPMGDNSVCGTGAQCTCNSSNQCGCTPTVCLM